MLRFDGCLEVIDGLLVLPRVEVHDAPIEQKVFLPEYVLLVVAEGFNLCGLLPQLHISSVVNCEGLPDLLGALHAAAVRVVPSSVLLLLQPLPPQRTHLLDLDALHVGYNLLVLADCRDRRCNVRFNIVLSI